MRFDMFFNGAPHGSRNRISSLWTLSQDLNLNLLNKERCSSWTTQWKASTLTFELAVHCQDTKFAFLIIASETQKEDLNSSQGLNLHYGCSNRFIDSFSVNYVYHCFRIAVLCLSKKFYNLRQLVGNDGVEPSWGHYQCPIIDRYMNCHWKVKMHAIARL